MRRSHSDLPAKNTLGVKDIRRSSPTMWWPARLANGRHRHRRSSRQDRDAGLVAHRCDRGRDGVGSSCRSLVVIVCASMHGDPLLAPSAGFATSSCSRWRHAGPNSSPSAPAGRYRGSRRRSQRAAAKALHARWGREVLVKGGHLRSSDGALRPALTASAATDSTRAALPTPAMTMAVVTRWRPRSPPRWRTASPCPTRGPRNDGLRILAGLSMGPRGPFRRCFVVMNLDPALHTGGPPRRVVVLTHGGRRRESTVAAGLRRMDRRGWLAVRPWLPPTPTHTGPPSGQATDAGIVEAIQRTRRLPVA